jgi:hypothetical protein
VVKGYECSTACTYRHTHTHTHTSSSITVPTHPRSPCPMLFVLLYLPYLGRTAPPSPPPPPPPKTQTFLKTPELKNKMVQEPFLCVCDAQRRSLCSSSPVSACPVSNDGSQARLERLPQGSHSLEPLPHMVVAHVQRRDAQDHRANLACDE